MLIMLPPPLWTHATQHRSDSTPRPPLGLLLRLNREWPLLLISLFCLLLWNTTFSVVLSRAAADDQNNTEETRL